MASRPRPVKMTLGVGSDALVIYGVKSRLDDFLNGLDEDGDDPVQTYETSVKSHQRRRYPGGPLSTVPRHDREGKKGGYAPKQTLPGQTAWFERGPNILPGSQRVRRQFTFVGTTTQMRDYCEANGKGRFIFRTPAGEPVVIDAGILPGV